jgi:hypothetical protein
MIKDIKPHSIIYFTINSMNSTNHVDVSVLLNPFYDIYLIYIYIYINFYLESW